MTTQEEQVRDVVARQAAEWFVRHRTGTLEDADHRGFDDWLALSPVHVGEYLAIAQLSNDLPAAAAIVGSVTSLEQLLERARADKSTPIDFAMASAPKAADIYRRSHVLRRGLSAVAAMLAVTGIAIWWWANVRTTVDRYATQHGEQRSWTLSDQSVVHLNTDTSVTVRYSRRLRLVQIERGQAYFEVMRDASRRFEVEAGEALVTDIGTKFDVYRKDSSALVTVVEGQVTVDAGGSSVRARAGEQVRTQGGRAPEVSPVDPGRGTAWLQKRMVFHGEPLREVVAEFNRYSPVPIVIESEATAEMNVSGALSTDDTPSFISFLSSINNVDVISDTTHVLVRERPAGPTLNRKKRP